MEWFQPPLAAVSDKVWIALIAAVASIFNTYIVIVIAGRVKNDRTNDDNGGDGGMGGGGGGGGGKRR